MILIRELLRGSWGTRIREERLRERIRGDDDMEDVLTKALMELKWVPLFVPRSINYINITS